MVALGAATAPRGKGARRALHRHNDKIRSAMLVGAIRSDLGLMAAAVSLLLGGIVVWGSNRSTAKEGTKELAASETERRSSDRTLFGDGEHSMACDEPVIPAQPLSAPCTSPRSSSRRKCAVHGRAAGHVDSN
jgi:hypothetical protein